MKEKKKREREVIQTNWRSRVAILLILSRLRSFHLIILVYTLTYRCINKSCICFLLIFLIRQTDNQEPTVQDKPTPTKNKRGGTKRLSTLERTAQEGEALLKVLNRLLINFYLRLKTTKIFPSHHRRYHNLCTNVSICLVCNQRAKVTPPWLRSVPLHSVSVSVLVPSILASPPATRRCASIRGGVNSGGRERKKRQGTRYPLHSTPYEHHRTFMNYYLQPLDTMQFLIQLLDFFFF